MNDRLSQPTFLRYFDKALVRALSLLLGFTHLALVMWDPHQYSLQIGGFNGVISPLLIWSICSSMVSGVGFLPRHWMWQWVFSPLFSLPILFTITMLWLT
ncbi:MULTISPECIES: cyd operon protein YbgE [unclassified Vibrio]|uniref:Cyd operon protein YbgE n=1 Tax=Vibrio sp. HB236076 TaxID=3232307 RepID=A0AB39HJY1_9VIBR|nr:cyd operon protein YbgE [Vibrio sp. HB161653]MDP5255038.1 cyd operon protein YbgE [Vibrio sp. HB161653]